MNELGEIDKTMEEPEGNFEDITRLTTHMRNLAAQMGQSEARSLVDAYYQMQNQRIRTAAQLRELGTDEAADTMHGFLKGRTENMEHLYASTLHAYAKGSRVGRWSLSVKGIGPVIAAGLLAHINIERCPNVGPLWRFAGLDPTLPKAQKGEKHHHNASLKKLCWKVGESFVKVSGREDAFYGQVYVARKEREIARNEMGEFQGQAVHKLETNNIGKDTDAYAAYSQGKLPPAHLHMRAKRYAVKLFLSHWHYVAFESRYGVPPEKPYILTKPEHSQHFITPPGWPMDGAARKHESTIEEEQPSAARVPGA